MAKKQNKRANLQNQGGLITAGEELLDYTNFEGKHKVWFAKAKYTYDAFSLGVDYVHDKVKNAPRLGENAKASEWVVRAGYKYSDKLSFNAWYSVTTLKYDAIDFLSGEKNNSKDKFNRLRFNASYNF